MKYKLLNMDDKLITPYHSPAFTLSPPSSFPQTFWSILSVAYDHPWMQPKFSYTISEDAVTPIYGTNAASSFYPSFPHLNGTRKWFLKPCNWSTPFYTFNQHNTIPLVFRVRGTTTCKYPTLHKLLWTIHSQQASFSWPNQNFSYLEYYIHADPPNFRKLSTISAGPISFIIFLELSLQDNKRSEL